ncbi:hypothetical protein PDE_08663 [Penicillium oxalicum 114-2]|uniref:Biogenesis of lysosome-related organelles complex 1 subunit 1 n=1 Tax=Penicillium oxalicum (strain 114-2 / CGMCC 5302) TaxID=933388 RepID=S7ZY13_PENO1|nr:hypothetical protein PDE_08663 [Penicillium oxalicum 114-2]
MENDTIMSDHPSPGIQPPDAPPEDHQKQEALAAFTATLRSVGTNLEAPLRDRAATIAANETALQRQEAELAAHTAHLARQNAQWTGWAEETREGLKEIGDVQNWAEMIERDLLILEDMMGQVEMGAEDEGGEEEEEREGGESRSRASAAEGIGRDPDDSEDDDRMAVDDLLGARGAGDEDGAVQNGNGLWQGKGKEVDSKKSSRNWLRWW